MDEFFDPTGDARQELDGEAVVVGIPQRSEREARTRIATGASNQAMISVRYIETDPMPDGVGHGILFADGDDEESAELLAFVDGFEWLHGKSDEAVVLIRKADSLHGSEFLAEVKAEVERTVKGRDFRQGPRTEGITVFVNG